LLNCDDQELTLNFVVVVIDTWKQSALEEAEEPEPEPRKRTMIVSKLTEGLGLN